MGLDYDYLTAPICKAICDRNILGVIAHRRFAPAKGLFPKKKYTYIEQEDHYVCPNQQILKYSTTDRDGYRHDKSDPKVCSTCPDLEQCTKSKNKQKVITQHIGESYKEKIRVNV